MIWYRVIPEQKLHGFARKPSALTGLYINNALGKRDPVQEILIWALFAPLVIPDPAQNMSMLEDAGLTSPAG